MFMVAKSLKNHEFLYSTKYAIACRSKKQADTLAKHLNENDDKTVDDWKLKKDEVWYVHEYDAYSIQPLYKIAGTKNTIRITLNY